MEKEIIKRRRMEKEREVKSKYWSKFWAWEEREKERDRGI